MHDWLIACIAIDDDLRLWQRKCGSGRDGGVDTDYDQRPRRKSFTLQCLTEPATEIGERRSAFIYRIKPDQRCTRFAATHKSQHTLELSVTQCALQESSPSDLLTESELSPVVTPESSAIGRVGRVALRPGRPVACTSLHG